MKFLQKFVLFLFGIVLVLLIGAFVVYFIISDDTDNTIPEIREENYTTDEIINREVANFLIDAQTKDDVTFGLSEYALNEILYSVVKDVSFINGVYADITEEGEISIEVPVQYSFFKTVAKLSIGAKYENDTMKFSIDKLSLGNLPLTSGMATSVLNMVDDELNESLANSGIYCTISTSDLSISMTDEDILNTLDNVLEGDDTTEILMLVVDLCLTQDDLATISFGPNETLGITLHTSNMEYDVARDGVVDLTLTSDIAMAKTKTTAKVADKTSNYSNVSVVYSYYLNGYDALTDEEKEVIDDLGLSSYESGRSRVTADSMAEILKNQKPNLADSLAEHGFTLGVSDSQMNAIFYSLDFVGAGAAFTNGTDVATINLSAMDITFTEKALKIVVLVDLNGKSLAISIDANVPDSNSATITAEISEFKIGNHVLESRFSVNLLKFLNVCLADIDWLSCSPDDLTFTFDLGKVVLGESEYAELLDYITDVQMKCKDGKLDLIYSI